MVCVYMYVLIIRLQSLLQRLSTHATSLKSSCSRFVTSIRISPAPLRWDWSLVGQPSLFPPWVFSLGKGIKRNRILPTILLPDRHVEMDWSMVSVHDSCRLDLRPSLFACCVREASAQSKMFLVIPVSVVSFWYNSISGVAVWWPSVGSRTNVDKIRPIASCSYFPGQGGAKIESWSLELRGKIPWIWDLSVSQYFRAASLYARNGSTSNSGGLSITIYDNPEDMTTHDARQCLNIIEEGTLGVSCRS